MWSRSSSAANEVQGLEAKCLLAATPLSESSVEPPALTNVDMNSLALMSEAGFIQINAIGLQDLSNLSQAQQSQFIYGPISPATTLQTPSEDLYDEGAGAVWGSLSDEGGPPSNSPGGTLDGTGAADLGFDTSGVNDAPIPETGDFPSADYGDTGPGDYGPGDTADTGYDATGALDSGFDDMGGIIGFGVDGPGTDDGDGAAADAGVDGTTGAGTDGNHSITAVNDSATTLEDTAVDVYVLANDHDALGHFLTVVNVMTMNGTATVNNGVLRFMPSTNFRGTATVMYKASDGFYTSNNATVAIDVLNVNDAPTITNPGNATFKEGDEVSVSVPAGDVDLPDDLLKWSIAGTLPGLRIEILTGIIRFKLGYATAGVWPITATVTDRAGATASTTFVWTILDAGFDTLTATEMSGSISLPNSITVPGPRDVLFVAPHNLVTLPVAALPPKLVANLNDVRYQMTGNGTLFVGDFQPTPALTMGAAGAVYTVTAYLDENLNAALDAAEFQLTLTIKVVNFGSATVHGGRVAGGVLYPGEAQLIIKDGELFDVTSTFKYTLVPAADTVLGDGAIVRAQLIRPGTMSAFANSAAIGTSFSVLLNSVMAGPAQVRFYLDANFNGVWDMGEPARSSRPFEIVQRNHLTRTYQYSLLLSGLTQASIQADVNSSMALALRKDSDDDWRAAVYTTVTPAANRFFAPSTARPDPADSKTKISMHLTANDGLTLLTGMSDLVLCHSLILG